MATRYTKEQRRLNSIKRKQAYLDRMELPTVVYCIPSINYVGVTMNLIKRYTQHSYDKDMTGFYILAECSNRQEALEIEKIYHELKCLGDGRIKPRKRYE